MRYGQEIAERYCQHAKMLRLIAAYDEHEPTRQEILKVARGYEKLAHSVAFDEAVDSEASRV